MSKIQKFYAGQKIFITGGTGFLGRVLIEKLLRSCPDIATIYLLIRVKKGKSVQERIEALLNDTVFENIRNDYPDVLKKVVGVPGDIAEEGLGLSAEDNARLVDEVTVIFHMAATIRFNERLDKAVTVNVNSIKSIIDIAKKCKNLKIGVHVSTAYSHCVNKLIKEELYPSPVSYEEINRIVKDIFETKLPEDEVENLTNKVLGEWPNTYSFTKAIAEGVVTEFAKEIPFVIFRPSIVISAYAEPLPGWLSGPIGLPGLLTAVGLGIMHVGLLDMNLVVDIVPVDYVCNALISLGWDSAISEKRQEEEVPVYNYVSRVENPVTWRQFFKKNQTFGNIYPFNQSIYYPSGFETTSILTFSVLEIFLHVIPAVIIDTIAGFYGTQPRLYKLASQIGTAMRALQYFSMQEWEFENQRVQNLWKKMEPVDKGTFPFSMGNLDWDEYFMRLVKGLQKYLLKEPKSSDAQARRRHMYLYILHTIVRLVSAAFVLWIIWKIFQSIGLFIGVENLAA